MVSLSGEKFILNIYISFANYIVLLLYQKFLKIKIKDEMLIPIHRN